MKWSSWAATPALAPSLAPSLAESLAPSLALVPSRVFGPFVLGGLMSLTACPKAGALMAAENGDLPTLSTKIDSGERTASLHLAEVADLARATASREVALGKGDAAVQRVREVRACAPELRDALLARAKRHEDAGAESALALLDAGLFDAGDARRFVASPEDAWRAVGVRGLTRSGDANARRRALVDPSPQVRRGALRAMEAGLDISDLTPVFEAARVDPDAMVRTDAVRLLVRFGRLAGDAGRTAENVTRLLRDLYPTADDPLREDIGAAWAAPEEFAHGGREALRVLLASEDGPGALSAAAAVLREPRRGDAEIETAARATLERAIASGARRNRLHAIAIAPFEGAIREPRSIREAEPSALVIALEKAALEDDLDVRTSALGRLASAAAPASERPKAILGLETIASRTDDPPLSSRARLLLAEAGDIRIQAWVERDLRSEDPWVRISALEALVALGRPSRGAPLLADGDVSVRTRGACALLLAARLDSAFH
jgi:hypothetical protein